jgi:hypothetical protein
VADAGLVPVPQRPQAEVGRGVQQGDRTIHGADLTSSGG